MQSHVCLPKVTKKRMVQLLQLLNAWPEEKITSSDISRITGWKPSLIRHDLWLLGTDFNGVSNGYYKDRLFSAIKGKLELQTDCIEKNLCIVGLGRLGAALLDQNIFPQPDFQIKAGFDSNVYRVELLRSTFPLYPASEMQFVIKREKIQYAVLTVADKDAQSMADRLIKTGIQGIVNMTNVVLKVPEGIKVENLSILNALKLVI